ncbi:hypothetical protein [Pseudomonas aeruginosa]|uniref:hypothetical protein n=1 Tax=Pseudomonas aeruginosa TaxID=287 RepID=UPI003B5243D7
MNNRSNLGAVAKDVTSSDSLKGYAVAGISGGFMPSSPGCPACRSLRAEHRGERWQVQGQRRASCHQYGGGRAKRRDLRQKVGDALVGNGLPRR